MSRLPRTDLQSIVAGVAPAPGCVPAAAAGAPVRRAPLKERARQLSVYLEPPVYDQLRGLAFAERAKMHQLMLEALDLLFRDRGTPSIDDLAGRP